MVQPLKGFGAIFMALVIIQSMAKESNGSNILGVFTSHSPSHLIIHMSIMRTLAERGHNVTVLSPMPPKVTHENIKHIVVPMSAEDEKVLDEGVSGMVKTNHSFSSMMSSASKSQSILMNKQVEVLEDQRFKDLYLNKDNKFDVVFFGFFFNTYQVALGARFNCPVIMSRCGPPMPVVNELLGNPELSSVPQMHVAVAQGQTMNFKKRLHNLASNIAFFMFNIYLNRKNQQFYE